MKVGHLAIALCMAASLLALPDAASIAQPAPAAPVDAKVDAKVDPAALNALNLMSAYLRTLPSFSVRSDTVRDEVNDNGQKLQFTGTVSFQARRPNGLVIETATDRKERTVYYDGKSLTVWAPRMGYYATVPAPATINEMLDLAADKYGIVVPLEDLFLWGTSEDRRANLTAGYWVGYALVAGQPADQYAFRQKDLDWQIWIARGDKPLPLRVVITTTDDSTQPQFASNLTWNTSAQFTDDTFKFTPPADAKQIVLTSTAG